MVKNTKNMIETFFFFHSTYSFLLTILCSVNFSRFKFWISWKFASFQPIRKSLETAGSSGGVWSSSLSFVVVLNFMMFMYGDENKKDFAWKRISADIRPSERSDELRHGGVLAGAFVELSKTRKTYSPHRLLSTACSINHPDPNMRQVNSLWGLWAKHVNTSEFSMWPNGGSKGEFTLSMSFPENTPFSHGQTETIISCICSIKTVWLQFQFCFIWLHFVPNLIETII